MSENLQLEVDEHARFELEKVKKQVAELLQQKQVSELAFGQQRAKFMELFRNEQGVLLNCMLFFVFCQLYQLRK